MTGDSTQVAEPGSSSDVLEGTLERIVYCNEENAWSVVRLAVDGRRDPVTAVGKLLGVQPGESLRLLGRWVRDHRYGEQFHAETYFTTRPATLVGVEKYLGSGLIRGIGKQMASRIVKHFEMDALEIIESHPERLTEVAGIGPVRSSRIRQAWAEQREMKEVMIFLQSHGVSTTYAVKIYKRYGPRSIAVVKENPYQLAVDIFGIGFLKADKIASSLGIAADSPRRAEAGVLHVLGELSDEGHVFCPLEELVERAVAVLEIEAAVVEKAISDLGSSGSLVIETLDHGEAIYLGSLHACETGAAWMLRAILGAEASRIEIDVERALVWFEEQGRIRLADRQKDAVRKAISSKVLVVTGGPGTGKTTIIHAIIRILEKKGRRIMLCAPTGRAAKRMTETSGREARTIHRLLEFAPRSQRFERNAERPLDADLVVVDEVSMLDTVLLYHLLCALPSRCQLVLVGDVDQLPSVGPGNVLRDLIRSCAVEVVTLDEIFRQARQSLIVLNAHRVNQGSLPVSGREGDDSADFHFVERDDPERALATIKELVSVRIPLRYELDPLDDIQVLTPMHKGLLGVARLNAELQSLLNPAGEALGTGGDAFRTGDKVMQIRNNYELDVFNGDIGKVESVDPVERQVLVRIEGRVVRYDRADQNELVLAYACSIHKAQGSEYPAVVIPVHTQHYVMLQRNLLYTGITRGRRLVVLVGSKRAVGIAVRNNKVRKRHTRLAERLSGHL
ncbi:MAG: ATP-dependent RecD-like DNA helicase [Deltaproteobacteria bacterium]|nr:ATP-dependent RecD-like DNA helicase [Deltaproteobacteria bacterium]